MPEPSSPAIGSRFSARWRIVAWILLTTAFTLLAIVLTARSLLLTEVDVRANAAIIQEAEEFHTFVGEGVDPATAAPFASVPALMERYLARQMPDTGETYVAVTDAGASVRDNAGGAGDRLASDPQRLAAITDSPATSGITDSPDGPLRWGKVVVHATGGDGVLVIGQFTGPARSQVHREVLVIVMVAAGGLLLTAGIAWLVAGQILRPVRDIRRAAEQVSRSDLSARVPVDGRDDLAEVARAVNAMLDRLAESYATQRHFIVAARAHLEQPLARIQRARSRLAHDPDSAEVSRAIAFEVDRVHQALADLRVLADGDRPDFLARAEVDLTRFSDGIHAEARALRGRTWAWTTRASGRGWFDPELVRSAVDRLLENAWQHAPDDGVIEVGTRVHATGEGRLFEVKVTNDGPPLTKADAERLFGSFADVVSDSATAGEGPRLGLGLAVVRTVADAHRGRAFIEVDAAGRTSFGLILPIDPPPAETDRVTDAADTGDAPAALTSAFRRES